MSGPMEPADEKRTAQAENGTAAEVANSSSRRSPGWRPRATICSPGSIGPDAAVLLVSYASTRSAETARLRYVHPVGSCARPRSSHRETQEMSCAGDRRCETDQCQHAGNSHSGGPFLQETPLQGASVPHKKGPWTTGSSSHPATGWSRSRFFCARG